MTRPTGVSAQLTSHRQCCLTHRNAMNPTKKSLCRKHPSPRTWTLRLSTSTHLASAFWASVASVVRSSLVKAHCHALSIVQPLTASSSCHRWWTAHGRGLPGASAGATLRSVAMCKCMRQLQHPLFIICSCVVYNAVSLCPCQNCLSLTRLSPTHAHVHHYVLGGRVQFPGSVT